ncbi:hypothetical protein DWZ37_05135 [Clostridiaceae bacterium AF31-3BH]|nr:hypothetical protein DWZ37_05135 [Clostridiaceae bacterium AF31-3BH]
MIPKMKRLLAFLMTLIILSTTICMEKTVVYATEVQEDGEKITDNEELSDSEDVPEREKDDEDLVYEEKETETFDVESSESTENDIEEKAQVNEVENISDDKVDLENEVTDNTETIEVHSSDGVANFANLVLFVDFQDTTPEHQEPYSGQCLKKSAEYTFNMFDGDAKHPFALKQYISRISYGQVELNNIFPQYDQENDQLVPYVLPQNMDYYYGKEEAIIDDAISQLEKSDVDVGNLDLTGDNIADNITVVVPCEAENGNIQFRDLRSTYPGTDTIDGVQIGNYNILTESSVYFGLQEGVIAHEFLHTLGYPDLYSTNGDSSPVGLWGIMGEVSYRLQYPLSYLRSKVTGWFIIPEVKESTQNYSLVAASAATDSTKDSQAVILKTDYSDTEFFVIEYRKQGEDNSEEYESEIPGSGLIIYRVNTACDSNKAGAPWEVYIFRPGDTYSENMGGELAEGNLEQAYLSSESGRTSYGSGDLESGLADGAITYADGKNSGIVIKNVGSVEGDTISFDIEFNEDNKQEIVEPAIYQGIDYSDVYDYQYYIKSYSDIKKAYGDDKEAALRHFVNNGMKEGRQGRKTFNVRTYKNRYADLRRAYGNDLKSYYLHYIMYGKKEGRTGEGTSAVFNPITVYGGMDYSAVYDYQYYIAHNADIKRVYGDDDLAVLRHFINNGMSEGRQGKEDFSVRTYKNRYADLRRAYGNDLKKYYLHYIMYGKKEGRTGEGTSAVFNPITVYGGMDYSAVYDYQYYIAHNADIKRVYGDDDLAVLRHFINNGMSEGRQGKENFSVRTYKNRYADLRRACGNDLKKYYLHYIKYGKREGRSGSGISAVLNPITVYNGVDYAAVYDYQYYVNRYADIKNAFGDDDIAVLRHFVNTGMSEGRIGSDKFNVYLYKANYPDLQKAYGNDLKAYYMHYLRNGRNEGRSGNISFAGKQSFQVKNCIVSSFDNTTLTLTLELAKKDSSISTNEDLYVVLMNSKGSSFVELKKGNVSSESEISVKVTFTDNDSFKAFAMGKYAIAVKKGDTYQIVSDSCMLKNPEDMACKDEDFKDYYWGYYEGRKVYSKKGIQDADDAYTEDLGVQNVLLNADIQDLVSTTKKAGYVPYTYKGTTYYFSDLIGLKNTIYDLHGWGNAEGGFTYGKGITRNVTLVLLMSWKHDELSYLIHPSARVKGAAPYYSLNMKDEEARNTFEALFCYMGEELGQMKTRVNNWTLGNELNSCNAWNYAGLMSLNDYVENYAQAFQMLHQAVKRTAASPRLFISLDHCWNVAEAGFSGKEFLDTFASYMNRTAPNMQWNVNFHSYSQPLSNNAFWNDTQNTTDSTSTRYISMRNISVLTDYLASLESAYGKPSGSIRVIIGELGYSSTKGGQEAQQAAALGYGYYIAMANKRIDAYIIRAYVDDPTETRAGLYLGLNAVQNGKHVKKTAYEVYKYLDRKQSFDYMNRYLGLIGIKSWSSAIPGFDANEIVAGEKMFQ